MLDPQPALARRSPLLVPLVAAALAMLTVAVFAPALDNGFVNFDDNAYVTGNPMVRQGLDADAIAWAATANVASNWHPLTMLSHMLDVELFGLDPRGHHLTSVLLHALNAALLFLVLWRLTHALYRSLAVAALFAVHPLRVESVAWVAERKDVLSTCFWLLILLAYLHWVRSPGARRFTWVAVLLTLGLMAKPMLVTVPCVLLLLDVWPLRRLAPRDALQPRAWLPLVREKWPLFAIVFAFCVVVVLSQGSAIDQVETRPMGARVANAALSYVWYAQQTVAPHDLAVYYPFRQPGTLQTALAFALLGLISATVVLVRRRAPYLAVGWFWYVGTLVPVIGLLPVGGQARADRFAYVPTIGLLIAAVWGLHALWTSRFAIRWPLAVATAAAVLLFTGATRAQIEHWHDSETLFRRALAVTGSNEVAHLNLAEALSMAPDASARAEARSHYQAAIDLAPEKAGHHAALGGALGRDGRNQQAKNALETALSLQPDDPRIHHALAMVLDSLGDNNGAREHLEYAVALDNQFAPALHGLGAHHDEQGDVPRAAAFYRAALEADPSRDLHGRLGVLLGQQGALEDAAEMLREAARRHPGDGVILFNLGVTLARLGDTEAAIDTLQEAAAAAPNNRQITAMLQRVKAQRADPHT